MMTVSNRGAVLFLLNPLVLSKLSLQNHLILQPTTELVVGLSVNYEKHLLRALADTDGNSSIIHEAYTSAPFIKTYDIFTPRIQYQETNVLYNHWQFTDIFLEN
jgi:hypothetical protein